MEIKTTKEIFLNYCDVNEVFKEPKKRWVAVDDLDLYQELVNKYGKVNVWGLNADGVCDKIKLMMKGWV